MEDSTAMTIEFLRARLLAERSVSRTARQRADELAKRVKELEKQLKIVSLQRKKAEKATTDVLAILERHGRRSDVSERFDSSSSDEEQSSNDFKGGGKRAETSSKNGKLPGSSVDGFSGSEAESSSVDGRSLSWKSSKDSSSRSLEKKYVDASRRRRGGFTSTGSSPKRVGKSCRQIRRREHRSAADGSEKDGKPNAHREDVGTGSECVRSSGDVAREDSGNRNEKPHLAEVPRIVENRSESNGHDSNGRGSDGDMKRALDHQARLIGRYEAEEKAQREWEDKFNENNGSAQDSYDPGIHSDVTEEIDETKTPPPPRSSDVLTPQSQQTDVGAVNEEPETSDDFPPSSNNEPSREIMVNDPNKPSSSPMDHTEPKPLRAHKTGEPSVESNELAFTPDDNPNGLGSVLEALQQAKMALKQNLNSLPLPEGDTYGDKFAVPVGSAAGLFRLPIDYQTATRVDFSSSSLTKHPTGGQFLSGPFRETMCRSTGSIDERFHMVPSFPYQEVRPAGPTRRQSDPRPDVGPSGFGPRPDMGPSWFGPRPDVGPSGFGPRPDVGPSGFGPRLDIGPSGFGPRLDMGPSGFGSRLDVGPPVMSDRYTRSVDLGQLSTGLPSSRFVEGRDGGVPPRTRMFFNEYTGPNGYE